jgi:hypothetical protein
MILGQTTADGGDNATKVTDDINVNCGLPRKNRSERVRSD